MKYVLIIAALFSSFSVSAQQKQNQYILIIRSKVPVTASSDAIKSNIGHWTTWMEDLGRGGKLAGGYRPGNDGATISGTDNAATANPYVANGEEVSSFLIINAADMSEAKQIAEKCPVLELQGNVEIRPIQNTAN